MYLAVRVLVVRWCPVKGTGPVPVRGVPPEGAPPPDSIKPSAEMIPTLFELRRGLLHFDLCFVIEEKIVYNQSPNIMSINLRIVVLWATIALCISQSSAFFLSWGRAEPPPAEPQSQWPVPFIYQQRLLQQPPPYQNNEQSVSLPAIPIQVPLQAQLAPAPNIHNVQLVPCLCPVTQEELDKAPGDIYNMKNKV